MADVTLKYKGATIGELSESGNKTIKTAGKYCEADILLEYEKSGGSLPLIPEWKICSPGELGLTDTSSTNTGRLLSSYIVGGAVVKSTSNINFLVVQFNATGTQEGIIMPDGTLNETTTVTPSTMYSQGEISLQTGNKLYRILARKGTGNNIAKTDAQYIEVSPIVEDSLDALITRTIATAKVNSALIGESAFSWCRQMTEITADSALSIGNYAFRYCTSLTKGSFASVGSIGQYAFDNCSNLEKLFFPSVTTIGANAFSNCSKLLTVVFAKQVSIPTYCFQNDTLLEVVDFLKFTDLNGACFANCNKLDTIIIRDESVSPLSYVARFDGTPFASTGSGGKLYVPQSQISAYESATNWSTILGYSNNQILPIEGSQYENYYADGTAKST